MSFKSIPLVGVKEVAEEFGITGERVRQLIKEQVLCPDFMYSTMGRRTQYFWIQLPPKRIPNGRKRLPTV